MPAFDPVRDAVSRSPVAQNPKLPSPTLPSSLNTSIFPHPSPSSAAPESAVSVPSPMTRRPTSLSMLLNDDPPPSFDSQSLFTPTTPRGPNTLSHLLHPDEHTVGINEQLAHATPLRRRSTGNDPVHKDTGGYFPPQVHSPLAFPGRTQERPPPLAPPSPPSGLALPGAVQSPALALPGLPPVARRPTPSGYDPSLADNQANRPSSRRSSGASDLWNERDTSPSYFTPPTRSPSSYTQDTTGPATTTATTTIPRPSLSPLARSPNTTFANLPVSNSLQPPSPTDSVFSRPSTSGSSSAPRPVSPTTTKRQSHKSSTSSDMPPPPVPQSHPASLPQKPQFQFLPKLPPSQQPPSNALSSVRSTIAYKPKRITPASSVLIPLSPAEIEKYRTFAGGAGTLMLKGNKRKRGDSSDDESDQRPGKRRGDVGVIAGHYNARPEVGVVQRQESPIFGLKSFNNWVKSVLITTYAHPAVMASPNSGPLDQGPYPRRGRSGPTRGAGKVLDMGCGKGGDLIKWVKARIVQYVGVDIAAVSIEQARKRYGELKFPKFTSYFTAADCYAMTLDKALPPAILPPQSADFDAVTMQFCMHYAFETEAKARTMLTNVSSWLRRGGVFIGTIPNSTWLLDHLDTVPKNAPDLEFGNSVYKIRFEERQHQSLYGHRYWFYLKDAVEDVPEYVVYWDNFVKLAGEYGLRLAYMKEFHEVFSENCEHQDFKPLLQHMKVVDSNGESQMDEDQWEAANIYLAFAFEKI